MSVKYIIGVDAALRNVGVGVVDNTGKLVESFNITTRNGMTDHGSVDQIVDEFFTRLERYLTPELCAKKATVFFFEDAIFTARGKGTARAEVVGVLKWMLRQDKLHIYGVAPQTLWSFIRKKFPTRQKKLNSKEKKQHTMDWLHTSLNFWTQNDNIADGVALALFGYSYTIDKVRMTVRAMGQIG